MHSSSIEDENVGVVCEGTKLNNKINAQISIIIELLEAALHSEYSLRDIELNVDILRNMVQNPSCTSLKQINR